MEYLSMITTVLLFTIIHITSAPAQKGSAILKNFKTAISSVNHLLVKITIRNEYGFNRMVLSLSSKYTDETYSDKEISVMSYTSTYEAQFILQTIGVEYVLNISLKSKDQSIDLIREDVYIPSLPIEDIEMTAGSGVVLFDIVPPPSEQHGIPAVYDHLYIVCFQHGVSYNWTYEYKSTESESKITIREPISSDMYKVFKNGAVVICKVYTLTVGRPYDLWLFVDTTYIIAPSAAKWKVGSITREGMLRTAVIQVEEPNELTDTYSVIKLINEDEQVLHSPDSLSPTDRKEFYLSNLTSGRIYTPQLAVVSLYFNKERKETSTRVTLNIPPLPPKSLLATDIRDRVVAVNITLLPSSVNNFDDLYIQASLNPGYLQSWKMQEVPLAVNWASLPAGEEVTFISWTEVTLSDKRLVSESTNLTHIIRPAKPLFFKATKSSKSSITFNWKTGDFGVQDSFLLTLCRQADLYGCVEDAFRNFSVTENKITILHPWHQGDSYIAWVRSVSKGKYSLESNKLNITQEGIFGNTFETSLTDDAGLPNVLTIVLTAVFVGVLFLGVIGAVGAALGCNKNEVIPSETEYFASSSIKSSTRRRSSSVRDHHLKKLLAIKKQYRNRYNMKMCKERAPDTLPVVEEMEEKGTSNHELLSQRKTPEMQTMIESFT